MCRLLLIILFFAACDGSKFSRAVKSKEKSKSPPEKANVFESGTPTSIPSKTCWFAVSGYWAGFEWDGKGIYHENFGKTQSGNPISGGERFDDAGGVYLTARAEPYEYQKGNREIDQAIDQTFDSIAVAPGMMVEIKDAGGVVLYQGEGPFFAESDSDAGKAAFSSSLNRSATFLEVLKVNPQLPDWVKDYVKNLDRLPTVRSMHGARSVQVTGIPSKGCS